MPSGTSRVQEGLPSPPPTPALTDAPRHTLTGMEPQQAPPVTTANAPSASTQRKGQEVSDGSTSPHSSMEIYLSSARGCAGSAKVCTALGMSEG